MTLTLFQASAHHLPMIPDESVHVICTSPPYWSLRAYSGAQDIEWPTVEYSPMAGLPPLRVQGCEPGCEHAWGNPVLQREQSGRHRLEWETGGNPAAKVDGGPVSQGAYCRHCHGWRGPLGLEPTPEAFIAHLILCLREWHRVLHPTGTCWVNLGDSYAGGGGFSPTAPSNQHSRAGQRGEQVYGNGMGIKPISGLKPKDLVGIPWRFALAAQADGFYLRSDMIWSKPNPMPESVTDRPTKAHEYIFLLAKQERYFYDAEAVREPLSQRTQSDSRMNDMGRTYDGDKGRQAYGEDTLSNGQMQSWRLNPAGRNLRSVLHIATQPTPFAHFATFPERIPEIAILAGTSAYGCCAKCLAGWVREVARQIANRNGWGPSNPNHATPTGTHGPSLRNEGRCGDPVVYTTGWSPSCTCNCPDIVPATVLDPFSGSCTTGKVALRLGRSYIGVDLAESYLTDITAQRLGDGVQMAMSY